MLRQTALKPKVIVPVLLNHGGIGGADLTIKIFAVVRIPSPASRDLDAPRFVAPVNNQEGPIAALMR